MDVVEQFLANAAYAIILVAICWNVLSRYLARTPAAWVEDVTSIAFAWLIFVGAAAVHKRRMLISVNLLVALLPKPLQLVLEKATDVFLLSFFAYAAFLGGQQTYIAHFKTKTSVLDIPLSVLFAGVTLGFALMALRTVQHLLGVRPASPED